MLSTLNQQSHKSTKIQKCTSTICNQIRMHSMSSPGSGHNGAMYTHMYPAVLSTWYSHIFRFLGDPHNWVTAFSSADGRIAQTPRTQIDHRECARRRDNYIGLKLQPDNIYIYIYVYIKNIYMYIILWVVVVVVCDH